MRESPGQWSRPPVSVVIPVWNAAAVTAQCLQALLPTLRPNDQLIVVDDGSTDGTPDLLAALDQPLEIVTHPVNLGFGAACNDGAALARHDLVIFLNNDTVPAAGWIDDLTAPFADVTIGAAGPMSDGVHGNQQVTDSSGRALEGADAAAFVAEQRLLTGQSWRDTTELAGFCLAVRSRAFRELGGFDLCYGRGGHEDDDLCLRLLLSGWRTVTVTTAYVSHLAQVSFAANNVDLAALRRRNRLLYLRKLDQAYAVSVLVRCGADQASLLSTLLTVADALGEHRYEVVLLVDDRAAFAEVLGGIGGQVRVIDSVSEDLSWQRGQHAATGLRRILLRAGDELTREDVDLVLAAPLGTQLLAS
jgi:GT2 family glycosyltransferase